MCNLNGPLTHDPQFVWASGWIIGGEEETTD